MDGMAQEVSAVGKKKIGKLKTKASVNFCPFVLSSLSAFNALVVLGLVHSENYQVHRLRVPVALALPPFS